MTFASLLKEKKGVSEKLKDELGLLKKYKALCLVKISDTNTVRELVTWLSILPANFVIVWEWNSSSQNITYIDVVSEKNYKWFDCLLCDDCMDDMQTLIKSWVVPIINTWSHLDGILNEFNPVKNQWNAFIYDNICSWDMYYAVVRYLENYKFPFDNKNLVRNISEM